MRSAEAPIYLVGMMGAGKSTVGAALASRLARRFVDLDRVIEAGAGTTIAQLFGRVGEPAFRALERAAIASLDDRGAVVATGGGTFVDEAARTHMLARGTVVYLRAPVEVLAQRLQDGMAQRPLLAAGASRLVELLAQRRESYERAEHVVDTAGLSIAQVVEAVASRVAA